mgnify:FL=1|jgi:hypothetical protein
METNLKILLMTNRSEYLIGNVTELDEEPAILIEKCFSILADGTLEPFPAFASQRDLFLTSESVLTIVDPSEQIAKEYKAANE